MHLRHYLSKIGTAQLKYIMLNLSWQIQPRIMKKKKRIFIHFYYFVKILSISDHYFRKSLISEHYYFWEQLFKCLFNELLVEYLLLHFSQIYGWLSRWIFCMCFVKLCLSLKSAWQYSQIFSVQSLSTKWSSNFLMS